MLTFGQWGNKPFDSDVDQVKGLGWIGFRRDLAHAANGVSATMFYLILPYVFVSFDSSFDPQLLAHESTKHHSAVALRDAELYKNNPHGAERPHTPTRRRPTTPRVTLPHQPMDANPANSGLESPKNVSIPPPLSPSSPYQSGSGDIPSEFIDAVNYLTLIKAEFSEQPEVYAKFLGILQEWASHP